MKMNDIYVMNFPADRPEIFSLRMNSNYKSNISKYVLNKLSI